MSADRLARYSAALGQLRQKGRLRALKRDTGADFTSNDYLGLAASAEMVRQALEDGDLKEIEHDDDEA